MNKLKNLNMKFLKGLVRAAATGSQEVFDQYIEENWKERENGSEKRLDGLRHCNR